MSELKAEIEGILRRYRKERQELENARPGLKRQYAMNWNLAHSQRLELVIGDLEMALLTVPRIGGDETMSDRPPRPLPIRPRIGAVWLAQVTPARQGKFLYYQHACGHIELWTEPGLEETRGGCDACESGSDDPSDWQPLWRMVRE